MGDKVFMYLPCFHTSEETSDPHLLHQLLHQLPNYRTPDKTAKIEKYFVYFSTKTYVVGTQKNRLNETVLLSTQNTCFN